MTSHATSPRPGRDQPPTKWGPAGVFLIDEEHGIYAAPDPDDRIGGQHIVWHWCPTRDRWLAASTRDHVLVSHDPLQLSPSLHLPDCCGLHGWVQDGRWIPV